MTRPSRAASGILLALGAAVLFAVNGNVSKVALLNGVSSLELVSVRSAGTAVILFCLTALRNPAALRVGRREEAQLAPPDTEGGWVSEGSEAEQDHRCSSAAHRDELK